MTWRISKGDLLIILRRAFSQRRIIFFHFEARTQIFRGVSHSTSPDGPRAVDGFCRFWPVDG
jgi:hypothetical protein